MRGFHSSVVSLVLFLGKRLGDPGCAFWCCTSVSFWIEGLSCVLFISGGKARRCGMCILVRGRRSGLDSWIESYGFVGKVSSGMGMLLSMDNCPCELSRAGRSFEIYTVVTWGFCNFVHFTFLTQTLYPKSKSTASLSCCPFVVITLTWYTYHRLTILRPLHLSVGRPGHNGRHVTLQTTRGCRGLSKRKPLSNSQTQEESRTPGPLVMLNHRHPSWTLGSFNN